MWHCVGHSLYWCVCVCVCVCVCQSENSFACFDAKPTQRVWARDLPRDRKDEGRKVTEDSQQKGAEKDSRHERSVKRRTQSAEGIAVDKDESRAEKREQKSERRLLRGRVNQREMSALLVALWEFSLEYTLALAQIMHKKGHIDSPLPGLRADPSPCLFVCSFLPPFRLCFA